MAGDLIAIKDSAIALFDQHFTSTPDESLSDRNASLKRSLETLIEIGDQLEHDELLELAQEYLERIDSQLNNPKLDDGNEVAETLHLVEQLNVKHLIANMDDELRKQCESLVIELSILTNAHDPELSLLVQILSRQCNMLEKISYWLADNKFSGDVEKIKAFLEHYDKKHQSLLNPIAALLEQRAIKLQKVTGVQPAKPLPQLQLLQLTALVQRLDFVVRAAIHNVLKGDEVFLNRLTTLMKQAKDLREKFNAFASGDILAEEWTKELAHCRKELKALEETKTTLSSKPMDPETLLATGMEIQEYLLSLQQEVLELGLDIPGIKVIAGHEADFFKIHLENAYLLGDLAEEWRSELSFSQGLRQQTDFDAALEKINQQSNLTLREKVETLLTQRLFSIKGPEQEFSDTKESDALSQPLFNRLVKEFNRTADQVRSLFQEGALDLRHQAGPSSRLPEKKLQWLSANVVSEEDEEETLPGQRHSFLAEFGKKPVQTLESEPEYDKPDITKNSGEYVRRDSVGATFGIAGSSSLREESAIDSPVAIPELRLPDDENAPATEDAPLTNISDAPSQGTTYLSPGHRSKPSTDSTSSSVPRSSFDNNEEDMNFRLSTESVQVGYPLSMPPPLRRKSAFEATALSKMHGELPSTDSPEVEVSDYEEEAQQSTSQEEPLTSGPSKQKPEPVQKEMEINTDNDSVKEAITDTKDSYKFIRDASGGLRQASQGYLAGAVSYVKEAFKYNERRQIADMVNSAVDGVTVHTGFNVFNRNSNTDSETHTVLKVKKLPKSHEEDTGSTSVRYVGELGKYAYFLHENLSTAPANRSVVYKRNKKDVFVAKKQITLDDGESYKLYSAQGASEKVDSKSKDKKKVSDALSTESSDSQFEAYQARALTDLSLPKVDFSAGEQFAALPDPQIGIIKEKGGAIATEYLLGNPDQILLVQSSTLVPENPKEIPTLFLKKPTPSSETPAPTETPISLSPDETKRGFHKGKQIWKRLFTSKDHKLPSDPRRDNIAFNAFKDETREILSQRKDAKGQPLSGKLKLTQDIYVSQPARMDFWSRVGEACKERQTTYPHASQEEIASQVLSEWFLRKYQNLWEEHPIVQRDNPQGDTDKVPRGLPQGDIVKARLLEKYLRDNGIHKNGLLPEEFLRQERQLAVASKSLACHGLSYEQGEDMRGLAQSLNKNGYIFRDAKPGDHLRSPVSTQPGKSTKHPGFVAADEQSIVLRAHTDAEPKVQPLDEENRFSASGPFEFVVLHRDKSEQSFFDNILSKVKAKENISVTYNPPTEEKGSASLHHEVAKTKDGRRNSGGRS